MISGPGKFVPQYVSTCGKKEKSWTFGLGNMQNVFWDTIGSAKVLSAVLGSVCSIKESGGGRRTLFCGPE